MTAYQGGKKQIGKYIYQALLDLEDELYEDAETNPLPYFEPFCGMCGVLVHFAKDEERERDISACDINKDIIFMWKDLQKGWVPPSTCTKERYEELKYSKKHSAERGFIGVVCSFGAQFFRGNFRPKSNQHDFVAAGKRGVLQAVSYMPKEKVNFLKSDSYDTFEPKGMLIYCDPPYRGNKVSNDTFENFDHDKFWNLMRKWSKKNIVVISEKQAPKDFISIWKKDYNVSFLSQKKEKNSGSPHGANIKKKYIENLFVHESTFD